MPTSWKPILHRVRRRSTRWAGFETFSGYHSCRRRTRPWVHCEQRFARRECPVSRKRGSGTRSRQRSPTKTSRTVEELRAAIERYSQEIPPGQEHAALESFKELKAALNGGTVRAAERDAQGRWHANAWVKAGILLGFRLGRIEPMAAGSEFPFFDKDTFPLRQFPPGHGVRIVPGGSAIRDGSYVAPGVI